MGTNILEITRKQLVTRQNKADDFICVLILLFRCSIYWLDIAEHKEHQDSSVGGDQYVLILKGALIRNFRTRT